MNILVTRTARGDLTETYDFIASSNPDAARRVLDQLFEVIRQLAVGDLKRPEVRLVDGRRARRWSIAPYRN